MDIKVVHLGKDKFVKFGRFLSYFEDEASIISDIEEVFLEKTYDFATTTTFPLIIDVGEDLGVAALFFKEKYPSAKIVCFESNPSRVHLCEKNLKANNMEAVTVVEADVTKNTAKLASYIHHVIDFFRLDAPGHVAAIISGLGKKILNVNEMICQCQSLIEAEKVGALLSACFVVETLKKPNSTMFILRAKRK